MKQISFKYHAVNMFLSALEKNLPPVLLNIFKDEFGEYEDMKALLILERKIEKLVNLYVKKHKKLCHC